MFLVALIQIAMLTPSFKMKTGNVQNVDLIGKIGLKSSIRKYMMKFYIAGPVSGQPNYNVEAFKSVADQITDSGNAALYTSLLPKGMSEPEYMKFAHAMLEVCDVVVLLPRWSMSEGATAEFYWAVKLGKKIVRQEHLSVLLRHWLTPRRDHLLSLATEEVKNMVSGARDVVNFN